MKTGKKNCEDKVMTQPYIRIRIMQIDTAYIQKQSTESEVESFHICDLDSAMNRAANLSAYHNEQFNVILRNENRKPSERRTVQLEKAARYGCLENVILYQECSRTKQKTIVTIGV